MWPDRQQTVDRLERPNGGRIWTPADQGAPIHASPTRVAAIVATAAVSAATARLADLPFPKCFPAIESDPAPHSYEYMRHAHMNTPVVKTFDSPQK